MIVATPVAELSMLESDVTARQVGREEWHRTIADARGQHPWLMRSPIGYTITSYDDCVAVLRERRFHSALAYIPQMAGVSADVLGAKRRPSILSTEGDEHGRLRRLVAPAFTPKAADRLRPYMREVINGLLDNFVAAGQCELVDDLCDPYPIPIICELLGAPKEDWKLFSRFATDLFRIFNGNLVEDGPIIARTRDEIDEYMGALIAERRAAPRDDLLSDMIAVEHDDDRLTGDELSSMAVAVLLAGTDTTRNQLGCTVAVFGEHPDQWKLLADHPELAPRAVEESMRYLGTIRGTARIASEAIDYRDVLFPQGTFVFPNFIAANFDEHKFADADRFDITKDAPVSPHLTFGSGIHYCLGAWLARAELQEALPILAQRMPNLKIDGDVTWKPSSFGIWGPSSLPLRFG